MRFVLEKSDQEDVALCGTTVRVSHPSYSRGLSEDPLHRTTRLVHFFIINGGRRPMSSAVRSSSPELLLVNLYYAVALYPCPVSSFHTSRVPLPSIVGSIPQVASFRP